jgi:hypothetical protein
LSSELVHQKLTGYVRMCRDNYKTERLWATAPDGTKVCNCSTASVFNLTFVLHLLTEVVFVF